MLLGKDRALLEGIAAFALLIPCGSRSPGRPSARSGSQGLTKAQPALLPHRGRFLDAALQPERVTREEIQAAIRSQGMGSLE